MADKDGFIWMDGKWTPWRDANVHILTHTLHYGMGAFEGIRAYETAKGPAIFRLKEHVDRFFDSAHIFKMKIPFDKETISDAITESIKRNNLKAGYIRPLCFLGPEGIGLRADNLKTHIAIAAWEWGAYLGKENLEKGIRAQISSFTRHHINVAMCKAKATGHYINSVLALQEAVASGFDEAILLDAQGYVTEGTGENIFIVKHGEIATPQLTSCLNGVTRNTVIQLLKDMGHSVNERPVTRDELYIADEIFFTGTAAEITPVREVDRRQVGNGQRGPLTEQVQSLYFDIIKGKVRKYESWLTYIS
jgi:branched-chain amino acid aminotransferase